MYKISWFPLAGIIEGIESFIQISFFLVVLIISYKFDSINFINLKNIDNYFFLSLFTIALISTILYNTTEIQKFINLSNLLSTICLILLYGIIFPRYLYYTNSFVKFVKLISDFGFLTAMFGILLYLSGYKPLPTAELLISFIRHPNGVSIILSISTLTTLYYLLSQKTDFSSYKKYFYLASFLIQFVAELLTQSRTGILALLMAFSCFLILYYRKKILFLLPFAVLFINFVVLDYILKKGAASFLSRFKIWIVAVELIKKNNITLWWGYGYTEGNKLLQKQAYYFTEIVEHPHNAYISLVLMFGILFLIVFLIYIIFIIVRNLVKEYKIKDKNTKLFINYITSSLLLIIFQGLFESPMVLFWYFLMPIFIIFLGINYLINIKSIDLNKFILIEN